LVQIVSWQIGNSEFHGLAFLKLNFVTVQNVNHQYLVPMASELLQSLWKDHGDSLDPLPMDGFVVFMDFIANP
jgi:hypothetical protein